MGKPKIRFKGYTDDWEQRKLGNFGKATGGTSIESEFSEDGIYKVINIGSYSENSIYNDQGIRAIKSDKTSNRVLNRNDLTMILNDKTTSGNIIGRVLLIEESGIYVYNQRTERIEIDLDEYDPVFLYEMLNAPNIREKIIKQAQGNTQIYVNWTAISLLEYMIPSKEEQAKIGEYLHSISNLITLHQRKCEETKKLKKYMLQKMFPQDGQVVPEIRFKGFTDAWEQRKLGDILERRIEQRQQSEEYPRLAFASGQGVIPLSERKTNNREQLTKDEFTKKYLVTELDDIVYNPANVKYGAIDRNKCGRGLISPIYVTFTTSEIPGFIERIVTSYDFQQRALRFEEGTVTKRQSVNPEDLVTLDVLLPHQREEQKKVGAYFDKLDHLITLHQNKCNELQNMKKFMLKNMFV